MGGREVFVLTSIRHSILVPMCNQRRGSNMQCARMLLPSALFIKSDFYMHNSIKNNGVLLP